MENKQGELEVALHLENCLIMDVIHYQLCLSLWRWLVLSILANTHISCFSSFSITQSYSTLPIGKHMLLEHLYLEGE